MTERRLALCRGGWAPRCSRPARRSPSVRARRRPTRTARPAGAPKADRFDSARAWAELRAPGRAGPAAGGLARAAPARRAGCARELPQRPLRAGSRPSAGCATSSAACPGTRPAIAIAAHYDTKDAAGLRRRQRRRRAARRRCSSWPARCARADRPPGAPELRFVLFDGEEATDDARPFLATGLRGSQAYAQRHAGEIRALILLDFVAGEGHADPARGVRPTSASGARLRRAARAVGAAPRSRAGAGARDHRRPHAVPARAASRRST